MMIALWKKWHRVSQKRMQRDSFNIKLIRMIGKEITPMGKTNEEKKEYLRGYQVHVRRVRRINAEIEELRSMKISPSLTNDGMPHGNEKADMSGYAAELDSMIRELAEERYSRIKAYQEIVGKIKKLKSENEKDVLFYRYIRGLDWWEIADKMRYGERHIYKIHGKALANLEIT